MNAAFHVKCYVCITWLIRRLFYVDLSLFLNALNKQMYVCHVFMYVRLNDDKTETGDDDDDDTFIKVSKL